MEELAELWPVAKGSLAEVRKPCGRAGCPTCRSGKRHGVFIFSCRQGGRQHCLYVPRRLVPAVRQAIANGRQVERFLVERGMRLVKAARGGASEGGQCR